VPREGGDSEHAAADNSSFVVPSRLESDTLRRFQKKASSPLNTKRCELVYDVCSQKNHSHIIT